MLQNVNRRTRSGTRVVTLVILGPLLATWSSIFTLFFSFWLASEALESPQKGEEGDCDSLFPKVVHWPMPPAHLRAGLHKQQKVDAAWLPRLCRKRLWNICLDVLESSASEPSHQPWEAETTWRGPMQEPKLRSAAATGWAILNIQLSQLFRRL